MSVVGVIGTGNMGGALVKGWLRSAPPDLTLLVWDKIEAAAERLLGSGPIAMGAGPEDVVSRSDVILVVVKPKDAEELLKVLAPLFEDRHIVVSSMAGVTLASLRAMLGDRPALKPEEMFYQRMLAGDPREATHPAREFLNGRSLSTYYDEIAL